MPGNEEDINALENEFTYTFAGAPDLNTVKSSLQQEFQIEVEDENGNMGSYLVKMNLLKQDEDLNATISTRDAGGGDTDLDS